MSLQSYRVQYFKTASGKSPVDEFVLSQTQDTRAKITKGLELLRAYGPEVGMPHVKYLGEKLYELRIRGRGESRLLFVVVDGPTLYVLHAFAKRTQKTPVKELETARKRMRLTII